MAAQCTPMGSHERALPPHTPTPVTRPLAHQQKAKLPTQTARQPLQSLWPNQLAGACKHSRQSRHSRLRRHSRAAAGATLSPGPSTGSSKTPRRKRGLPSALAGQWGATRPQLRPLPAQRVPRLTAGCLLANTPLTPSHRHASGLCPSPPCVCLCK